jgi:hypothetical protein
MGAWKDLIKGNLFGNTQEWARNNFRGWRVLGPILLQLACASLLISCIVVSFVRVNELHRGDVLFATITLAILSSVLSPLIYIYALHRVAGTMRGEE